jgi:osmotically-inducible protein OsmY
MTAMILPAKSNSSDQCQRDAELTVGMARAELSKSSYRDLKGIRCDGMGDMMVLRGEVGTYYLKQLAQETIRPVDGVQRILNMIRVTEPAELHQQSSLESVERPSSEQIASAG